MSRFEAVLLDYCNTVAQFDRPQIEWIHSRLAGFLSRTIAPIEPRELGEVMDRVCVLPPMSTDKREFTAFEQMLNILREAYAETVPIDDQTVTAANCEYQNLFVRSIKIDDSVLRVIERICRQLPVGLVSNYPCGASLRRSLHSIGLLDLLDPIVVSGDVGYVKPHPKLFQAALEALGVPAGKVLLVGDDWASDMVGGHRAGMVTCHHLGHTSDKDYADRYRTYRPDFSIHHLTELPEIVTAR
jgi:HAD superfamily hydrolase (TIGR01549 family)